VFAWNTSFVAVSTCPASLVATAGVVSLRDSTEPGCGRESPRRLPIKSFGVDSESTAFSAWPSPSVVKDDGLFAAMAAPTIRV